jgi:ArsR family transcriptional regulator, arsenate/arsenite/antimonite-responsive transcriptional repressor
MGRRTEASNNVMAHLTELDADRASGPQLGDTELSPAQAQEMAAKFKALGDPVRLRLFSRLAMQGGRESCVCDIQDVGVSQPTVSHHLKKLREAGLIVSERRGTWVYCRVAPGVLPAMARMLGPCGS